MNKYIYNIASLCLATAMMPFASSCEREIDTTEPATAPQIADVFIDGFGSGVEFQAWGKTTNLGTDTDVKHDGTTSLCISVPDPDDPAGSWAGGTFYTTGGRDLTEYNCLTFYAKASVAATMEAGIGNYGDAEYVAGVSSLKLGTNWKKYIIPIPNASKLTCEQGLFYYSAGAVNGAGYAIWIDDVRFEKLGTLAHARIMDKTMPGFVSGDIEISQLEYSINLPDGTNQNMNVSSKYFTFESSDPEIATLEGNKIVFQGKKGEVIITSTEVEGEIRITDIYDYAPAPAHEASKVMSIFSDDYETTISSGYNAYWGDGQTTQTEVLTLGGNAMIHHSDFGWLGMVFTNDTDLSSMEFLHMDILLMTKSDKALTFTVAPHRHDGFEGNTGSVKLETGKWVSLDVPLNPECNPIHELVLGGGSGYRNDEHNVYIPGEDILIDNVYFYKK